MAGTQPDEKVVHALLGAVGTNMDRLRLAIDALRQIHNWHGNNGTSSINLIAQLSALKSKLGQIHDWLNYAMSEMHPHLLSDLTVLMSSCGLLVRHMDALIDRLQLPNHDAYDCAIKLKYAVGGRSMERLRKVALGQTDALALLLAACKW
jgi:guanine nucleotide-binding protein G(i) subunit alpha